MFHSMSSSLSPIIVALDVDTQAEAMRHVDKLGARVDIFKVGLQLFSREGFPVVDAIISKGKKVFVDLKLHDIPNTVSHAVQALVRPGVEFLTVHASGGEEMMRAAAEALQKIRAGNDRITTRLLAVTVLTSLDENDLRQIGVDHSVAGQVLNLSRVAKQAGIVGLVASPQEVALLRSEHRHHFVIVTPGVRPASGNVQDQKRVMTPAQAMKEGSDFLVMGRSLLDTPDPQKMLQDVLSEIGR